MAPRRLLALAGALALASLPLAAPASADDAPAPGERILDYTVGM